MEKSSHKFIWKYICRFKKYFAFIFFFILLSTLSGAIYPYYFAKIYDVVSLRVENPHYLSQIIRLSFIGLAWGLFKIITFEVANFTSAKVLPKSRTIIYRDVFDEVSRHSINFFCNEMSGRVATKVEQLASGVQETLDFMFRIFMIFLNLATGFVLLSVISLYFMSALLVWIAAVLYIGSWLGRKISDLSRQAGHSESQAVGVITDSFSNYSEVKSFANTRYEHLHLMKYLKKLQQNEIRAETGRSLSHGLQQLIMGLSVFAFLFLSVYILYIDKITAVEFIYANTLFTNMSFAVFDVSWTYILLSRKFGRVNSALETLARQPEISDRPGAKSIKFDQAAIRFDHVSFGYKDKAKLFDDLDLEIKAGEKIGLVGLSGAGKSTFVKLIARYFDVDSGAITINGIDIRDLKQDSLHRNISSIPQDTCLFNRTLLENIRYGKTNATQKEIIEAAKKASADDFINRFPEKYQTIVGERGVILSGGERQRIAIARAILKDAPILIFDEATSALDSESEKHIQDSLRQLMQGKTVIAIAHRLSTLREMDRILVFDNGKIVEQGSHLSLLRQKGIYAGFYQMQADGFVGIDTKTPASATL